MYSSLLLTLWKRYGLYRLPIPRLISVETLSTLLGRRDELRPSILFCEPIDAALVKAACG